ncbi:MAG TPA: hypothetical protein PKD74_02350 [Candidatus Dependentiae bacterium]|nr:hypothetical protein [Candidatus Dependentiae bacterium]
MNKILTAMSMGLLCFCAYSSAMEEAVESVAQDIVEPILNTAENFHSQEICTRCVLKNGCASICVFCKKHPGIIIASVVAVAAVIAYTIPAVKEEIQKLVGVENKKQNQQIVSAAHSLPQEKIENSIIA